VQSNNKKLRSDGETAKQVIYGAMSRKNNPHVVRFFRDNCIIETDAEALHKELWQRYCDWTHFKGMRHTLCLQSFYQHCKKAGFKPVSDRQRVVKWKGVMLRPSTLDDHKLRHELIDRSGNSVRLLQGRTHIKQDAYSD
jgi:ribosomal protein S13